MRIALGLRERLVQRRAVDLALEVVAVALDRFRVGGHVPPIISRRAGCTPQALACIAGLRLSSLPSFASTEGIAMRSAASALVAFACLVLAAIASAQIPAGSIASNVRVVGYSDVDGRPPFKLSIRQANGRWYLYAGHLWHRGWTVLDVTDPAKPTVANFIPG